MSELSEAAIRYAGLGLFIFPLHSIRFDGKCGCSAAGCGSPGKHPRIRWKEGASCDVDTVRAWWLRWPTAGIGLACGPSGIVAFDADGIAGVQALGTFGPLPRTARSRTARGVHVLFRGSVPTSSDPVTKLDVRGVGGYVVLPPSPHASGHVYRWDAEPEAGIADCPPALLKHARAKKGGKRGTGVAGVVGGTSAAPLAASDVAAEVEFTMRLATSLAAPDWIEVDRAMGCVPADCCMDDWLAVGMALHSTGHPGGLERWDRWSAQGKKYREGEPAYKWTTFKIMPEGRGLGTLFNLASKHGYVRGTREEVMPDDSNHETRPPLLNEAGAAPHKETNGHSSFEDIFGEPTIEQKATNPLIRLNQQYAVIGNVGGKCLVLEWQASQVDERVKVPSFQTFRSFSERYANEYITVTKTKHLKAGDEDYQDEVQLGAAWLKWTGRRTYQGVELAPNQAVELPNGNYNLWQGWGVMPAAGEWPLMRAHIAEVLASGDPASGEYILRWAAWAVQNPDRPAKVALVLRGGKGAGKGAFLTALRALFGSHGLQIYNRAHLVGSFNAHLRNCLFLFADEAFWAGDKQGESTLKGLITEPVIILEQKGVDAVAWPNRVKMAMAANAAWVVPATADERRYAVFDVSDSKKQNLTYFGALRAELAGGGLAAMLHDLLTLDLGDWSPMMVPQTKALQDQKAQSMPPLVEWWEGWLQESNSGQKWAARTLMAEIREATPAAKNLSNQRIAKFLQSVGATKRHTDRGTEWELPEIGIAREAFTKQYGKWDWSKG